MDDILNFFPFFCREWFSPFFHLLLQIHFLKNYPNLYNYKSLSMSVLVETSFGDIVIDLNT